MFVRRPIRGAVVAFATVPGVLTGAGLILAGVRGDAPPLLRVGLGVMGAVMVLACVAVWGSSSGVLVDRERRTVTPVYRVLGASFRGTVVSVGPGDSLVVHARSFRTNEPYVRMVNRGVYVSGPAGLRFVMSVRTADEATRSARAIADLLDLPIA